MEAFLGKRRCKIGEGEEAHRAGDGVCVLSYPLAWTARKSGDGAGEGNRTLVVSLGSFCSAIELHPPDKRRRI